MGRKAQVDVRATRNALLPVATGALQYTSNGLGGNSFLTGAPTTVAGAKILTWPAQRVGLKLCGWVLLAVPLPWC
jgi:hypothetical protein